MNRWNFFTHTYRTSVYYRLCFSVVIGCIILLLGCRPQSGKERESGSPEKNGTEVKTEKNRSIDKRNGRKPTEPEKKPTFLSDNAHIRSFPGQLPEIGINMETFVQTGIPAMYDPVFWNDAFILHVPGEGIRSYDVESVEIVWKTPVKEPLSCGLGIGEDILVLGTEKKRLMALDPQNGNVLFDRCLSETVLREPIISEHFLYVLLKNGKLLALENPGGEHRWEYTARNAKMQSFSLLHENLILLSKNGHLVSLDAKSGEELWKTQIDGVFHCSPAITKSAAYQVSKDGTVFSISTRTGEMLWKTELYYDQAENSGIRIITQPAIGEEHIFIVENNGILWSLEKTNGVIMRKTPIYDECSLSPLIVGKDIFVVGAGGVVNAYDQSKAELLWSEVVPETVDRDPIFYQDTLYVITRYGEVYVFFRNPD